MLFLWVKLSVQVTLSSVWKPQALIIVALVRFGLFVQNARNSDIYQKITDEKMSEFLAHHCITRSWTSALERTYLLSNWLRDK